MVQRATEQRCPAPVRLRSAAKGAIAERIRRQPEPPAKSMTVVARPRPLSPHLSIWRWRIHTITSIMHRATGNAMALGVVLLFVWWLAAAATGPDAYRTWYTVASGPLGYIVGVGATWVLFQHMASGIRHLVMDTGANLEISRNKRSATATFVVSTFATLLVWALVILL